MSTPKRPGSRFGDGPTMSPERGGAPLPLVTQPMIPIALGGEQGGDPAVTRIDNPLTTLKSEAMAAVFGRATQAMVPVGKAQTQAIQAVPVGPPPEIGLTQHHLPPDEPADRRLALFTDPDSERAAAFRVLRHHLLEVGRPQCVVVSSPRPGDGKTTTALNLALALAECGRAKVLLVETHVRRPQLAEVFKFVPPWCFAEQLVAHRHQPMMPWSLIEIPQLWLHVGAINPRIEKTQFLDGPAFAYSMERLRLGGYDHIVVDAPPVLGSADVNLLADVADAVVFSLRARRSTTRDLRRAMEQIETAKSDDVDLADRKIKGVVLVQD
jgi:Mrp family chromosome partitioning ATPase